MKNASITLFCLLTLPTTYGAIVEAIPLDTFDEGSHALVLTTVGSAQETQALTGVFATRTLDITATTLPTGQTMEATLDNSSLTSSIPNASSGTMTLTLTNPTTVDLTENDGSLLYTNILFADAAFAVQISAKSIGSPEETVTLNSPSVFPLDPAILSAPFSLFPNTDFTQIESISLSMSAPTLQALDVIFTHIGVGDDSASVPEPSVSLILTVSLSCLLNLRRRQSR